jgi:hypothetical protein
VSETLFLKYKIGRWIMSRNVMLIPSKHIRYESLQFIIFNVYQGGQMTTPWGFQEEIPSCVSKIEITVLTTLGTISKFHKKFISRQY